MQVPGALASGRNHPLVPGEIPSYDMIVDVQGGKVLEVRQAMAFGAPMQEACSRAG
jgi:hypothetical protein